MIPIRYDAIAPFEDGKAPVIQLPYEDHFFINYKGEFLLESLRNGRRSNVGEKQQTESLNT